MSLHLQKFIERVRGHEARASKDFVMPMADAKGMAADLTELLLELRTAKEALLKPRDDKDEEVLEVVVTGGTFKN
jgi:hypothetical protein